MGNVIYNIIMFIINLAFLLAGAAVLAFGIILLTTPGYLQDALDNLTGYQNINYLIDLSSALSASGILLTVVGSVIMAVSLIGLFTCCCNKAPFYIIYSVFLGLIIAFEIAAIIFLSVNYTNIQDNVSKYMYSALRQNFLPVQINPTNGSVIISSSPGAAAWETMQFTRGCCGAYGPGDFSNFDWQSNFTYNPNANFPPSCCIQNIQYKVPTVKSDFVNVDTCITANLDTPTLVNAKGCYIVGMGVITEYGYITNIVIASLIALEVIILQMTLHQYYSNKLDNKVFA